jgi:hypothetical protein
MTSLLVRVKELGRHTHALYGVAGSSKSFGYANSAFTQNAELLITTTLALEFSRAESSNCSDF